MCSGNSDALTQTHELGEHDGAWHHRNISVLCLNYFRVVCVNRSRGPNHAGISDIGCVMADKNFGADRAQMLDRGVFF